MALKRTSQTAKIIANMLLYKYIDESFFHHKFMKDCVFFTNQTQVQSPCVHVHFFSFLCSSEKSWRGGGELNWPNIRLTLIREILDSALATCRQSKIDVNN